MTDDNAFAAFLSYSHASDREFGPVLQVAIEKFARPWYRPRARRVFLDNSVLAAESDLTQAIIDGLSSSRNFLLLASPESAASHWVGKEVEWWLANRDPRSLFVLLTGGDARWHDGELDETSALPPQLRDIKEPRLVDLRGLKDKPLDLSDPDWVNALYDIIPPLDGVSKDELTGHHVQTRRQTTRVVSGVILALVALLVAATTFAVISRQQTMIATSRQLVAQASALRDTRPDVARQLLAQAYRLHPGPEVLGALVDSPSIPRVLPQDKLTHDVAFSPDGEWMAVARVEGVVLYRGTEQRATIPIRENYAKTLAFSPDGKHLAIGTYDPGRLRGAGILVEVAAPDRRAEWSNDRYTEDLSFVPGKPLILATEQAGRARFIDISDPSAPTPRQPFIDPVESLNTAAGTLSPDGRTYARGAVDRAVELWDVSDQPTLRTRLLGHKGHVSSLRFAPTGGVLLSGSEDSSSRLWNVADGTQYAVLTGTGNVRSTAFSPDGTTVAIGDANGTIALWDVTDPARPRTAPPLLGHTSAIHGLAFSRDSHTLASASQDGPGVRNSVRLWHVAGAVRSSAAAVVPGRGPMTFTPDSKLVIGTDMFDVGDPSRPRRTGDVPEFGQGERPVEFSPQGTKIATGMPVMEIDLNAPRSAIFRDTPKDLAYSPDGKIIAAAEQGEAYQLWTPQAAGTLDGSFAALQGVAFSPDGQVVVAVGRDGERLQFWDVGDPSAPKLRHAEDTSNDPVTSVAFQGRTLIVGTTRGAVSMWDNEKRIASVVRHVAAVNWLAPQPGGTLLASSGEEGELVLWDVSDLTRPVEVSALRSGNAGHAARIAFSPDGTVLAAQGRRTVIWRIDAQLALGRLCADSAVITEAEWKQYLPDDSYDPPCV